MTPFLSSYWTVFRFVFVIIFLYHLNNIFYVWDGFRYYASFSEFLPNVALVSIFRTIIVIPITLVVWSSLRLFKWFIQRTGWKIRTEYLMLFLIAYGLLLAVDWVNRKLHIFQNIKLLLKQTLVSCRDWIRDFASTSEFLPDIAQASILWSAIVVLTVLLAWFSLRCIERFCHRKGWTVNIKQLLLFLCVFLLSAATVWVYKTFIITFYIWEFSIREIMITCLAIFLTWEFRNKAGQWKLRGKFERISGLAQEYTIRLAWLFGILVILSVPLVAYHTWFKQADKILSSEISQSSPANNERPNFILVTFDALTSRDMSLYGYHRETTPFISEWAKGATVFNRAKAEDNFTTPTTASIMTGKRLWTHQVYHLDGSLPVKSDTESLPFLLKKKGYYNAAFIVNHHASIHRLGISNSFDFAPKATEFLEPYNIITATELSFGDFEMLVYRAFGEKMRLFHWIFKDKLLINFTNKLIKPEFTKTTFPPEKAFNSFLEIYDALPEPFFVWIHVFPPHRPYNPPQSYNGMFENSRNKKTDIERIEQRDRYDEFIRYCDRQFEEFIIELNERDKQKNRLKNTTIILSSDHGESFQHGVSRHNGPHLYEQVTHIPLIIKEPEQIKGRVINDIVEQIDIPATILDLANIRVPLFMDGRSLVPILRNRKLPPKPAFSMHLEKNRSRNHKIERGTIAVWEGDYKLIHYLEENKSLLFNLKKDPDELNNIIEREPEIGQHLLNLIYKNLKAANKNINKGR